MQHSTLVQQTDAYIKTRF